MEKQILDASLLIGHWRRRRASVPGVTAQAARKWAQQLIGIHKSNAILTPIRIEFLVGATSSGELGLFEAYLEAFHCVDDRKILERDWQEAERLAKRIPPGGKRCCAPGMRTRR